MEALGLGLQSLRKSIGTVAVSIGWIYVIGIGCKTVLIYTGKARIEDFKDWFKFKDKSGRL